MGMPADLIGISLQPNVKDRLDELAKQFGLSRSATVAKLLEIYLANGHVAEVIVDGVRYTPTSP